MADRGWAPGPGDAPTGGGPLIVTRGAPVAVQTDELVVRAEALGAFAREIGLLRPHLAMLGDPVSPSRWSVFAGHELDRARMLLAALEAQASALAGVTRVAAYGYEVAESAAAAMGAGGLFALTGWLGRMLPAWMTPTARPVGMLGFGSTQPIGPQRDTLLRDAAAAALAGHPERMLTHRGTVETLRRMVMGADEAALAVAGLPPLTALLPGEYGVALAGAAVVGVTSAVGLARQTPVVVASVSPSVAIAPATGAAGRFERIPQPDAGGEQVRIERYEMPSGPDKFEVFVAGTVTFDPRVAGEPFDLASNLENAAGGDSGAVQAVVAAMREAGVTSENPVQLSGYSQGAATAAWVAASGDFDVQSLTTFGGAVGLIDVPDSVSTVHVAHSDDLVTALGGDYADDGALIVRREVFASEVPSPDSLLPAHEGSAYRQTAALMDASADPALAASLERMNSFADGAVAATATTYRLDRVEVCVP